MLGGSDPTGSNYRNGYLVRHRGQQLLEWSRATDVTTRFDSLYDHKITPGICSRERALHRTDLPRHQRRSSLPSPLNQACIGIGPENLDNP